MNGRIAVGSGRCAERARLSRCASMPAIALDHLVVAVAASTTGRAWCEANFGVGAAARRPPCPDGHAQPALLARVGRSTPRPTSSSSRSIPTAPAPAQPRWFDLDDAGVAGGDRRRPRLVHWVARCDDIEAAVAALAPQRRRSRPRRRRRADDAARHAALAHHASRRRPPAVDGAMPLWIQWSGEHPSDALPTSGIAIESLEVGAIARELAARLGSLVRRIDSSSAAERRCCSRRAARSG